MQISIASYVEMIKKLMPKGKAWSRFEGSVFDQLAQAIADEFARVGARAIVLLDEADPRTTSDMLTDWERITGLPDDCTGLGVTLQDRRRQILARLVLTGPQNKQLYINLAAELGYTASVNDIQEYLPFRAGISRAGDRLTNGGWVHAFSINLPAFTTRPFYAGRNTAGDRLVEFGDDVLECVLTDHKPAHATIIFKYT